MHRYYKKVFAIYLIIEYLVFLKMYVRSGVLRESKGEVVNQDKEESEKMREIARKFVREEKIKAMTDSEYFSLPYYSASLIRTYETNPSMVEYNKKHGEVSTPDKTFGIVLHKAVLENEEFEEKREDFLKMITPARRKILEKTILGIKNNDIVQKIIGDAEFIERPIIFEVQMRGKKLKCKSKIDLFTKKGYLIDLKTLPSLEQMKYKIDYYRYDLQLSFYVEALKSLGKEVQGVIILAVEKNAPHESHLFEIGEELLMRGAAGGKIFSKEVRGWEDILEELHFDPRKRFEGKMTLLDV